MIFLFLLALVFAIPTTGLSIVAFVAFAAFKGYAKGRFFRARAEERDQQDPVALSAQEPALIPPSWSTDPSKMIIFRRSIETLTTINGIPAIYIQILFNQPDALETTLGCVGLAEREGVSFEDQQFVGIGFVNQMWTQLDEKNKQMFVNFK
jgi:hypothetical protein